MVRIAASDLHHIDAQPIHELTQLGDARHLQGPTANADGERRSQGRSSGRVAEPETIRAGNEGGGKKKVCSRSHAPRGNVCLLTLCVMCRSAGGSPALT